MIRVLLLCRYRAPTMFRKVEAMTSSGVLQVYTVFPQHWRDYFFHVKQQEHGSNYDRRRAVPVLGSLADPHRALYGTLTFGIRTFRPHLIHAEEEPDSLAALQVALARRLFAPRVKLLLHTWQNQDRPKRLHVWMVLRLSLAAADAVFCANREAVELLRRWGYRRPTPLIPALGVDTETFRPCPPTRRSVFTVGYVGRLVPEKGIDVLLDALAQLRARRPELPLRAEIVGSGPEEAALRLQVQTLGLAAVVRFVAFLPPPQVAHKLCDLDALVLPSRTTPVWKEQLGRVLLEAMACGVPVIGSVSGAIPEVIGNAGLLFPEGDATALAAQLERLAADPALRATLRHRGMARVQQYSHLRLAAQTVAFYQQMLA